MAPKAAQAGWACAAAPWGPLWKAAPSASAGFPWPWLIARPRPRVAGRSSAFGGSIGEPCWHRPHPPPAISLPCDRPRFGHGVGMSQWGALCPGQNRRQRFEEFLRHYYQGAVVRPIPRGAGSSLAKQPGDPAGCLDGLDSRCHPAPVPERRGSPSRSLPCGQARVPGGQLMPPSWPSGWRPRWPSFWKADPAAILGPGHRPHHGADLRGPGAQ